MITINVDMTQFVRLANVYAAAGKKAPVALSRALNATGGLALTQMRRSLVKQTGMKYGVFVRALKPKRATPGSLEYRVTSRGGNVSLKFFRPREGRGGVTAYPWNRATRYEGAFLKSGPKGKRARSAKLNGHVFKNIGGGKWRGKIEIQKSGLYIPDEMIEGASKAAFESVASTRLPSEIERALYALLSGVGVSARESRFL